MMKGRRNGDYVGTIERLRFDSHEHVLHHDESEERYMKKDNVQTIES